MSTLTTITETVGLSRIGRARRTAQGMGPAAWAAIGVLAFVLLLAVFGPSLVHQDPNEINLSLAYGPPQPGHPLGFDGSGRDLFTRLVYGARTALLGPLVVVLLSTVLGTIVALTAVWYGGWLDATVARVVDAMFAFPGLLLAILATALFGAGLHAAVVALAIAYTPYLARIIRSAALRERSLPYVAALRVQGLRGFTISIRHILPNISGLVLANATLSFGFTLIDLAALSYIGLGVQAPTADWGAMVAEGVAGIMQHEPAEALYASLLIVVTVGAANLLGDRLNARAEAGR